MGNRFCCQKDVDVLHQEGRKKKTTAGDATTSRVGFIGVGATTCSTGGNEPNYSTQ